MSSFKQILSTLILVQSVIFYSQSIVLEFCPVEKISASREFSATMKVTNEMNQDFNILEGKFYIDWPSLTNADPGGFESAQKNGDTWNFLIRVNYSDRILQPGDIRSKNTSGSKYTGDFLFPTNGEFRANNGNIYPVEIRHCMQSSAYEIYDNNFEFNRECFVSSPKSGICIGEAATEIWGGEGIYDVMIPQNRPSWAISTLVGHLLFSNLVGDASLVSHHFWPATALQESGMNCDPNIIPNRKKNCYLTSDVRACQTTGVGNYGVKNVPNCYQILPIGYQGLSGTQPTFFTQTNQYGTAQHSTVVGGDTYETGAIAMAYFHYRTIKYLDLIKDYNLVTMAKDSQDEYFLEKFLYYAYHDGENASVGLLAEIQNNYSNAMAAQDIHVPHPGGGFWAEPEKGSQKVANYTSLLDDNGTPYYQPASRPLTEYYGCYEQYIKWTDIEYYLDRIKILYPHILETAITAEIKNAFDQINNGNDVQFSNIGPVIDEIVFQMGGEDPSDKIGELFGANQSGNAAGISLKSHSILCPGDNGEIEVWLAGDAPYNFDILYPDGSSNSFSNVQSSPYIVNITQPGTYEVTYFEDQGGTGELNCNFSSIIIPSLNRAVLNWDKTNIDNALNCISGELILNKVGDSDVSVSYSLDGAPQPDITLLANEYSKKVLTNPTSGTYQLTNMTPNECGVPLSDVITICSNTVDPCSGHSILDPNFTTSTLSPCQGELAISYAIDPILNADSYTWNYTGTGSTLNGSGNSITIDFDNNATSGDLEVTAINSCGNSNTIKTAIAVNEVPQITVQDPTAQCDGDIDLTATPVIQSVNPTDAVLSIFSDAAATTPATNPVETSGAYYIQAVKGVCKSTVEMVTVEINTTPDLPTVTAIEFCEGEALIVSVDAPNTDYTYDWSANSATNNFAASGDAVQVNATAVKLTDEGTYDVIATENGCISNAATLNVDIDTKPSAAAVNAASLDVCSADQILLNAQTVMDGAGTWSTISGTGTIDDPILNTSEVTGMVGGDQLVAQWEVQSANDYCPRTQETVTINAVFATDPSVGLSVDPSNATACEGDVIAIKATGSTAGSAPIYRFYDYTGGVRGSQLLQGPLNEFDATALTSDLEIEVELESNSSCIATTAFATATLTIPVDALPAAAVIAGKTTTCVDTESLTADVVNATDIVSWAVTSGPGTMANQTASSADVAGLVEGQTTEVTLTVASANGYCPATTDVITIDRLGAITPANVNGQSTALCEDVTKPRLSGTPLQAGETATWTSNTTGATIDASTGAITAWVIGANEFEYTIGNSGGCTDSDIVTITVDQVPTTASVASGLASATIQTCEDSPTLNADAITVGTGLWRVASGTGNIVTGQEGSENAQVENLDENDNLVLEWTVSNGACTNHPSAQLTVDKAGDLTTAAIYIDDNPNAIAEGATAVICKDNFTIEASVPSSSGGNTESGVWSIGTSAVLGITGGDENSATPSWANAAKGTTTLTWEISTTLAGCNPSTRSINVEVIDVPVTDLISRVGTTSDLCAGDGDAFSTNTVLEADSYVWDIDGAVQTGETLKDFSYIFTTAGTYNVNVAAKNQCGKDLTAETIPVKVNPIPTIVASAYNACDDGNAVDLSTLVTTTASTIKYYSDVTLSTELASSEVTTDGIYGVTATENACVSPLSVISVVIKPIPSSAQLDYQAVCGGEELKVWVVGSSATQTYTWNTPSGVMQGAEISIPSASSSDEGLYSVSVEENNCYSSVDGEKMVALTPTPSPGIQFEGNDVTNGAIIVCKENLPQTLAVTGTTTEDLIWSFDESTSDNEIRNSGLYSVIADNGVCTGKVEVSIEVRAIAASISLDQWAVDQGTVVTYSGTVSPYRPDYTYEYVWSGAIHGLIGSGQVLEFAPVETDDFVATVTELETGCRAVSETENVIVYLPLTIPAAFTPNGDGENDLWLVEGLNTYEKASLKVFNRWGQLMFEAVGDNFVGWDGYNQSGTEVTIGTYYYVIQLNDELGRSYRGDVSVLR